MNKIIIHLQNEDVDICFESIIPAPDSHWVGAREHIITGLSFKDKRFIQKMIYNKMYFSAEIKYQDDNFNIQDSYFREDNYTDIDTVLLNINDYL